MMFEIGQKVVCINPKYRRYCAYPLVKGKIYTVDGFYTCECGSLQIFVTETPHKVLMGCSCHRSSVRRQSYYIDRFRPLQYFHLYREILESSSELGVKSDLPEPNPEIVKINE